MTDQIVEMQSIGEVTSSISPLVVRAGGKGPRYVMKYVGDDTVPQDIKRRRRQALETMRRMGEPVVVKKMYTDEDLRLGIAERSPNYDTVYGQTRNEDPLSYGVGYVSKEKSEDEWISPSGNIVRSQTDPGEGYIRAPKYRGYGQGFLTYIIQPDVPEDVFKVNDVGALIRVRQAIAQAPWYPPIEDNDLIVNVTLDQDGQIAGSRERYIARMVAPVAMRGYDRRGKREFWETAGGNRFVVNQQFQMDLLSLTDNILYRVDIDR